MELFEKTLMAVQEFDSTMTAAKEAYSAAKKEIHATFKSPTSEEKLTAAKAIFEQTGMEQQKKAREAVKADFEAVRGKIYDTVTAAAPADFAVTLEALKVKGKAITDYEIKALLSKYDGNYLAISTIVTLDATYCSGKPVSTMIHTPDKFVQACNENEAMILNWIQNYKGGDYMSALLTDEKNTPLKTLVQTVESFLSGGFLISGSEK